MQFQTAEFVYLVDAVTTSDVAQVQAETRSPAQRAVRTASARPMREGSPTLWAASKAFLQRFVAPDYVDANS